jgi:hypothetical protein
MQTREPKNLQFSQPSRTTMPPTNKPPDWRNSNAKKLLEEDIKSGRIPLDPDIMDPEDVYLQRPEFSEFEFKRFRDRLHDLQVAMKKKQGKPLAWRNSKAKKLLEEDLKRGRIPLGDHDMKAEVVYFQRPEFSEFEYERFRDRLGDLRAAMIDKVDCAASDSAALAHDRRANCHPKPTHNHRGELCWEGGEAERLLHLDMDDDKHKRMKPEMLHITRAQYRHYPLTVFRLHIDQEVRARKYLAYHRAKKNKQLLNLGLPALDELAL